MPDLLRLRAIFLEIVGGPLLPVGFKAGIGAILLIVFLIPATITFHRSGLPEQSPMVATLQNLAILGAILKFLADGSGSFCLENPNVQV